MKPSLLICILVCILISGCNKEEINPADAAAFGKLEIVNGDNQTGYFGEELKTKITIKASSSNNRRKYFFKYEMVQGNGTLQFSNFSDWKGVYADSTGILDLNWSLGCDFEIQKIKISLFVDSLETDWGSIRYYSTPSDSIIISAVGDKPIGWGKSCGINWHTAQNSKIISYDQNTLFLVGEGIYSSVDGGQNWEEVKEVPNGHDVVNGMFNSRGWLYLLTYNFGICYSKDLKNWEYINHGLLSHGDPTAFLVEDSALFVSFYSDGPYKTVDNGAFWRKLLIGDSFGDRYYNIKRHPNGDIYIGTSWISKDYGKSWERIQIENKYKTHSVLDFEIDPEGSIYIGGDGATISKITPHGFTGDIFRLQENSSQYIADIQIIGDKAYVGIGGTPSAIYSSQNWQKMNLDFNREIVNFYLKKDGTFLIHSYDGLYHYYQ